MPALDSKMLANFLSAFRQQTTKQHWRPAQKNTVAAAIRITTPLSVAHEMWQHTAHSPHSACSRFTPREST